MTHALVHSDAARRAVRCFAAVVTVVPLFLLSYLLAIAIQQAVVLITAKQLGGYNATVRIGGGQLVASTEIRMHRIELRERWWERPEYLWQKGMTPQSAIAARLAGLAMNLLLAAVGILDLRHRRSRGLWITVSAHLAAALTAVAWGFG